ncbi:ribonuclease P protein component [Ignatzschineria cameli]|uniref:ribonuclease P protein component n=1 Tax=Ignatzschineria cameli TaxID=2182793 RepID=UPI000D604ADA|nr:ribonuclease P protein component [Ignatzschineria cameli]PWD87283.1 ribonuclease P protein component [Ignatzschineria cameli]
MNNFRFEREKRLLTAEDYSAVFKDNRSFKDRSFLILVKRANSQEQAQTLDLKVPRLGLAISKKNFKRAVDRNLVKRVVRESFRNHQALLTGLDIVVMSRATTDVHNSLALHASLEKHWEQISKICVQS